MDDSGGDVCCISGLVNTKTLFYIKIIYVLKSYVIFCIKLINKNYIINHLIQ